MFNTGIHINKFVYDILYFTFFYKFYFNSIKCFDEVISCNNLGGLQ